MQEKLKVLLFENDPGDTQIVEEFLSESKKGEIELISVSSLNEGINILKKNSVSAVLFDLSLPDKNMPDSLIKIRSRFPEIPFILLTDFGNKKIDPSIINGIDTSMSPSGYCNYLYKHRLNSPLLVSTIHHAVKQQNLYSERKRMEENLRETLEKLERSNKDLEQFAYAVSHDLCEPLRSISGFIQLLARRYKGNLDEDADRFISRSMAAAARMQDMITNILEYSRLNSSNNEFTSIDCNEVLNHVIANLEGAINESKTKITHDHLPTVSANFLQLLRVFQNLIANAIKFHSGKRPEIHVGVKRKNNNYQFSISDNGIGIDPKHFELIFVIFQRLHNRQEYPGSGAGLAICKKIVERHGGTIWVESEVGRGSTFYFTIPIKNKGKDNDNK